MNQQPAAEHMPASAGELWPAVAGAAMACWTTDPDLRFTAMDGAGIVQVTGEPPDALIGKSIAEVVGPSLGPQVVARLVAAYRAALAGDTVALESPSRSGRWRIHLEPLRDEDGEICGVLGVGLLTAADAEVDDLRDGGKIVLRRRGVDVTAREWEVLERLRRGATTREIAEELWITPATVRSHVASLCQKLGVAGRDDLLRVLEPTGR